MFECVAQLDDKRFNMPSPILTTESVRLCECVCGSVCVCEKCSNSSLLYMLSIGLKGIITLRQPKMHEHRQKEPWPQTIYIHNQH